MNPNAKNLNDLDPKLKETYERVMGTSLNPAPTQPQAPVAPVQTPQPQVSHPSPQPNSQPLTQPNPQPVNPAEDLSMQPPQPTQYFKADDPFKEADPPPPEVLVNSNETVTTAPVKKKHGINPFIIILAGLVFFVVYGVVWAKVFGLF